MYPIKFENLYYEKIWGGRDFESFRDNLPPGNVGESWDIACHKNGMSIVQNGKYKGVRLDELIEKMGDKLLGNKLKENEFPLLVKLINSKEKLSVQVHPDDIYARKFENSLGKTEAWYVIDSKPESSLIVGTKNCNKEIFEKAIKEGKTSDYLNEINVKKGDCFFIKSGLVHAIGEGVVIAEIQQNSDITYRIYDYGRPREIHIEKSLDVIDFDADTINLGNVYLKEYDKYKKGTLYSGEHFTIEKYIINGSIKESSNKEKFFLFTCVEGCGSIYSEDYSVDIKIGDSIMIPAYLGDYILEGDFTLLKSYI